VTLVGAAILLFAGGAAAAAVAPGTVLASTTATLPAELSSLATGKRIAYVTTSVTGATTTTSGLVMTPKAAKRYKTVVWGHGTTGLADACAPSANQAVFWPEARAAIAELLRRGWTVAAPDYPGLGTPTAHPYLIGLSAARSMIDIVRSARSLDATLSTQYAVDGHSQGGQGSLFAGQIAASYDGPLVLKGVVSIAPVSNTQVFAPLVPGTPGQGYLVMALYGLSTVNQGFNPNTVLAPPAKQKTAVLQTDCLYPILDAYAPLTAEQLLTGGALPQSVVDALATWVDPAGSAPTAPVLIVQGTDDEAVPYDITAGLLVDQVRAYRTQPVEFVPVAGANHDSTVFATTGLVADWIATRFA
jgi:pimeloyl-ACP methyl ester carboxylesterase